MFYPAAKSEDTLIRDFFEHLSENTKDLYKRDVAFAERKIRPLPVILDVSYTDRDFGTNQMRTDAITGVSRNEYTYLSNIAEMSPTDECLRFLVHGLPGKHGHIAISGKAPLISAFYIPVDAVQVDLIIGGETFSWFSDYDSRTLEELLRSEKSELSNIKQETMIDMLLLFKPILPQLHFFSQGFLEYTIPLMFLPNLLWCKVIGSDATKSVERCLQWCQILRV